MNKTRNKTKNNKKLKLLHEQHKKQNKNNKKLKLLHEQNKKQNKK